MSDIVVTIGDVRKAFRTAQDCVTVTRTVRACLSDDEHHTDYGDDWRRSFDEKADELVAAIMEELGGEWTSLSLDTQLGPKAKAIFREVRELLPD